MIELIKRKRQGGKLSKAELSYIINGFTQGDIPDYQMAALLMAICFQGLDFSETVSLTEVMMLSGETIDLSEIKGIKVDKHSTGGVGDKTSLIVAPLVAAAGAPVGKMSGRGLGHTGGTLDKLESIPGFSVNLSKPAFIDNLKKYCIVICGQNDNLVPADKKIYALRDVTATVDNISLISSSIMSKKLACGADAIVLDVKVGAGSHMKTLADGEGLANMLINIGKGMNRQVRAVISAMDEPLGLTIGNALEVKEAIQTLQGNGPEDLTELCLELGSHMLELSQVVPDKAAGRKMLLEVLDSGAAFEKFKEMVKAQGGDVKVIDHTDHLPISDYTENFISEKTGYITQMDARNIGIAAMQLGAGRATKKDQIDYGAGIVLKKKIGSMVQKGEPLATLYTNKQESLASAKSLLEKAYRIEAQRGSKIPLILKVIK